MPREALSAGANRWTSLNDVRNIGGVLAFVFLMMAAFAPSVPWEWLTDRGENEPRPKRLTHDRRVFRPDRNSAGVSTRMS